MQWTGLHPLDLPSSALYWLCHRNIGISSLSVSPTFVKVFQHIKSSLSSFAVATCPRMANADANMTRVCFTFLRSLEISKVTCLWCCLLTPRKRKMWLKSCIFCMLLLCDLDHSLESQFCLNNLLVGFKAAEAQQMRQGLSQHRHRESSSY